MRQLERERRGVWFAKYKGKEQVLDEEGRVTGTWRVSYDKPVFFTPTVRPRSGNTWGDGFGIGVDCDRTLIIDRIDTGIDETCILWVDVRPQLDKDGNILIDDEGLMMAPNDYVAVMVGESYNFTSVAIKKVD